MRQPVRVAVTHAESCQVCEFHALTIWGSKTTWIDCRRADCDNHAGQKIVTSASNARIYDMPTDAPND